MVKLSIFIRAKKIKLKFLKIRLYFVKLSSLKQVIIQTEKFKRNNSLVKWAVQKKELWTSMIWKRNLGNGSWVDECLSVTWRLAGSLLVESMVDYVCEVFRHKEYTETYLGFSGCLWLSLNRTEKFGLGVALYRLWVTRICYDQKLLARCGDGILCYLCILQWAS